MAGSEKVVAITNDVAYSTIKKILPFGLSASEGYCRGSVSRHSGSLSSAPSIWQLWEIYFLTSFSLLLLASCTLFEVTDTVTLTTRQSLGRYKAKSLLDVFEHFLTKNNQQCSLGNRNCTRRAASSWLCRQSVLMHCYSWLVQCNESSYYERLPCR
jgi:hypothetical protein